MLNDTGTVTIATAEYESIKTEIAELKTLVKYYEEQLWLEPIYNIMRRSLLLHGALFRLERRWKALDAAQRQELRLKESKPLAEAFFVWLEAL